MASKLNTAIEEIAALIRAEGGLTVPTYPTEDASNKAFVVIYPSFVDFKWNTAEDVRAIYSINVEIHYQLKDWATAIEQVIRFSESIPKAIYNGIQNNNYTTIQTIANITGSFGQMEWGNDQNIAPTVGWRWTLEGVKILDNL